MTLHQLECNENFGNMALLWLNAASGWNFMSMLKERTGLFCLSRQR